MAEQKTVWIDKNGRHHEAPEDAEIADAEIDFSSVMHENYDTSLLRGGYREFSAYDLIEGIKRNPEPALKAISEYRRKINDIKASND